MKADSIIRIEAILKQQRDSAHVAYKNIRNNLKERYGTEWLENEITQTEKDMLHVQKQICNDMDDLYEDFMSHQW